MKNTISFPSSLLPCVVPRWICPLYICPYY